MTSAAPPPMNVTPAVTWSVTGRPLQLFGRVAPVELVVRAPNSARPSAEAARKPARRVVGVCMVVSFSDGDWAPVVVAATIT